MPGKTKKQKNLEPKSKKPTRKTKNGPKAKRHPKTKDRTAAKDISPKAKDIQPENNKRQQKTETYSLKKYSQDKDAATATDKQTSAITRLSASRAPPTAKSGVAEGA